MLHQPGRGRSCRARLLRRTFRSVVPASHRAPFFRSSVLGSIRLSPDFIATTTSADFRPSLKGRISPGQCWLVPLVPTGSTEFSSMTVGLRVYSPARPLNPASLPVRVPTVESLPPTLSGGPSRFRPGLRLRLLSSTPSGTLIPLEPAPAGHTSAPRSRGALGGIAGLADAQELPRV